MSMTITHASFLIPAERLHETPTLLAFYHPRPSYPVHILLVPKRHIASMIDLAAEDSVFLSDVFATVRILVERLKLDRYRLICNGGNYQDVPQLHFHLIVESASEA